MNVLSDKEHDFRLRLHSAGLINAEIARLCGRNRAAISVWIYNNGLTPNYGGRGRKKMKRRG